MKKMILGIVIALMSIGLTTTSAEARVMRGGAMSHRPVIDNRGASHGPRVHKTVVHTMAPVGVRPATMHYGMRLATRPAGIVVNFGGLSFIYNDGIFYSVLNNGFEVVRPTIGMIVPSLPVGHTVIMRNNIKHFTHNGVIYRPVRRSGTWVYRVEGFI